MKNGPKPLPLVAKLARGTYRPDRDTYTVELTTSSGPPQMPDYLSDEAAAIWDAEVGRAMAAGVGELDSGLFGRYCATEAAVRQAFIAGSPPPAAYLAELRRHAELLGIAGPKSRTIKPSGGGSNPFARNGQRPKDASQ